MSVFERLTANGWMCVCVFVCESVSLVVIFASVGGVGIVVVVVGGGGGSKANHLEELCSWTRRHVE